MLADFDLVPTNAKSVRVGSRYGRLTVFAVGQVEGTYRYYAVCQCDCGSAPKRIRQDGLTSGVVTSCGCYQSEQSTKHGLHSSPHYGRWRNMIDRCDNEDCVAYPNYGGRGVRVCDRWYDIETYINDLPEGYFEGAHLDRIDNDGDYEPSNVRWVTPQKNHNNRRSTNLIEHDGRKKSLSDWAREKGLSPQLVWDRINNCGWSIEQSLNTPPLDKYERMRRARAKRNEGRTPRTKAPPRKLKTVLFYGVEMTIEQISILSGVSRKLLRKRIFERGWTAERAVIKPDQ